MFTDAKNRQNFALQRLFSMLQTTSKWVNPLVLAADFIDSGQLIWDCLRRSVPLE
jgi:hypothetical protein